MGSGCGKGVPSAWIAERAAVVQCTTAGPHRMPPIMGGLPAPAIPAGLYARSMDPEALDGLGFARDQVVCAVLESPAEEVLAEMGAGIEDLVQTRANASRAAMQAGGKCTCDAADALGLRALIRSCLESPTEARCDRQQYRGPVGDALAPMLEALASTPRPLVHWRLVGVTDRPGWFVRQSTTLLPRYEGGSTVYVPGQAVPRRNNHAWVKRLLETEDVTAVVVQDAGRAVVVLREVGRWLVLDHLAYPPLDPANVPMLALWDNARLNEIEAWLERPQATRALGFSPKQGNLIEVDRGHLGALDALWNATGPLRSGDTEEPAGRTPKIDRVTLQAPFGRDGQALRAQVELSATGRAWAGALSKSRVSPTLEELALPLEPPGREEDVEWSNVDTPLFDALEDWAWIFKRVELDHPGTIGGTGVHWKYVLPQSDLSDLFGPDGPWSGVRQQLAERPYRLEATVEDDGERLSMELVPR